MSSLNDYPAEPPRERITDAFRVYPGDGIAPLTEMLRHLRAIGFRGFLSLELFNDRYWHRPPGRSPGSAWKRCGPWRLARWAIEGIDAINWTPTLRSDKLKMVVGERPGRGLWPCRLLHPPAYPTAIGSPSLPDDPAQCRRPATQKGRN